MKQNRLSQTAHRYKKVVIHISVFRTFITVGHELEHSPLMDFSVWGRQFTLWTFVSFQRSKATALLSLSYSLAQITPTSWSGKVQPRDRFCVVLLFCP